MTNIIVTALAMAMTAASAVCTAQVQYDGYAQKTKVDGADVYLFTQSAHARMSLKQSNSGEMVWTFSPDGVETETLSKEFGETSEVAITKEGLYGVKDASGTETKAWWLSPRPESVSFIVDSADCEAVYVTATSTAPDITFGSHTLKQEVTYQWEKGDSVLLTTKHGSGELYDIYDKGAVTVRAINQAFNEATATDTVTPKSVKAEYDIENRKDEVENEATATGEALSAPAEIALTNNSKGRYTVCEWEVGTKVRLYDRNPVYQFQQPGTYTITLTITNEETGCASVDSSKTVTISDAALEFPNAFTPNGDGVNDLFMPSFRSLKKYELTIYNRWGRRVFETNDPSEGWDGTEHGNKAAAGTYYYVATGEGYERGVSFRRKGSVTLVR